MATKQKSHWSLKRGSVSVGGLITSHAIAAHKMAAGDVSFIKFVFCFLPLNP